MRKIYIAVLAVVLLSCMGKPPAREVTEEEKQYDISVLREYDTLSFTERWRFTISMADNFNDCHYAITSLINRRIWLTPDETIKVQRCFDTLKTVQSLFSSIQEDIHDLLLDFVYTKHETTKNKVLLKRSEINELEKRLEKIDISLLRYSNGIKTFNEYARDWNIAVKKDVDVNSRTIPYIPIPSL
jgi:Na+/phosphate symporter